MADKDIATFKDSEDREWGLVFTIGRVRKIKELGIDFPKLQTGEQYLEVVGDDLLFANLLWMLCSDAGETRGISQEQFEEALAGDVLTDAEGALGGAIVNFTRSHLRKPVRTVLEKAMESKAAVIAMANDVMRGEKTDAALQEMLVVARAEMESNLTSGKPSRKLKESLETTQAR